MSLPRLARTISTICLLLASSSALAALSSEFAVSDVVLQPAELTQRDVVVATDGLDYFGAWVDDRTGPVQGSIRYTVVRATGTVERPLGQILNTIEGAYPVAAVWSGEDYVLFIDGSVGGSVTRIDRNGLVATPPFRILADGERILSVATNGSTYLVLLTGGSEDNVTLSVKTLDSSLRPIRETALPVPQPAEEVVGAVAANDTEYGVVWGSRPPNSSNFAVATIHIDGDGVLLDAAAKPVATVNGLVLPRIASNDNGYLVSIGEFDGSLRVTSVFALDDDATVFTPRVQIGSGLSTGLLWGDGFYLVPIFNAAALQDSDISIVRVNTTAQVVGSRVLTAARAEQSFPAGASRSERVFWAWNDGRRTPGQARDVYFTFTDTNGVPLEGDDTTRGVSITYSAPVQKSPNAAFDGTNYLVAWLEAPDDESIFQVIVGRVSGEGLPLDSGGVRLSESQFGQHSPRVAFDGTNYVVIWREGSAFQSKLYGARVSPAGEVIDRSPLEIADVFGGSSYSLASNRSATLVVFGGALFSQENELRLASITKEGQVIDRGGRIIQTLTANPTVDIATNGSDYLVAWSTTQTGVSALRVLANGTVEAKRDVSPSGSSPSIAFGGGQYLVTYSTLSGNAQQIRGRIVNLQGTPTAAPEELLAQRSAIPPTGVQAFDVAYDGIRFALAWTDPDFSNHPHDPTSDLRGRQVARGGTPLGTVEGILISVTPGEDSEPAVAPGLNRALIVYSRVAPEATGVRRLFGRFLSTEETPRQRPARRP